MAGSDSRFSASKFRDAIHFAMQMGFPEDSSERLTWKWITQREFHKEDSGGLPYEWKASQVVSETVVSDLSVKCAIKFTATQSGSRVAGTALGVMDVASAVVTLLDTEYDLLLAHGGRLPDQAEIDGALYEVQFVAPPTGLFDVTVYDVYIQAVDEA